MVILAKISLEEKREIRFSSILELYSWEHFEEIKELRIDGKNLTKIPKLPEGLLKFDCWNNQIEKIEGLPEGLLKFYCSANRIKIIPKLPEGLLRFDCRFNQIKIIEGLPASLLKFNCGHNRIKIIEGLYEGLLEFCCWQNQIKIIERLPEGLMNFYCSNNQIKKIEGLPEGLLEFNCWGNQIEKIERLPEGLLKFWCMNNPIKKIENIPKSLQFLNNEKYIQSSIIVDYYNEKITKEEFIEKYKVKTGRNLEKGLCLISHDVMEDCIRICDKEDHLYEIDMFCGWYHNKPKKCAYCGCEFDL